MVILIDPARWPAHGTTWAHLVSDASLTELHAFAAANGLPSRAFDLDHYDVPADRVDGLVAVGATPVPARELLRRLRASGLRVRGADRGAERSRSRRADLTRRWAALDPDTPGWAAVGRHLLDRWSQPHRRYHDAVHLAEVLGHLDVLADGGEEVGRAVVLAAWFHDAVYDGEPGRDEERSAELAAAVLAPLLPDPEVAEVGRLVRLTASHAPGPADRAGAALCDADLAILAAPASRYRAYVGAVRAEYRHVPEPEFRAGRARVLARLLAGPLFSTAVGRSRWASRARANMLAELTTLT
ncbi:MAG: DUF4031 domain-containing protein [Georgenia sp.]